MISETEKDLNQHLSAEDCHIGSEKGPTGLFPIKVLDGSKVIFKVRPNLCDYIYFNRFRRTSQFPGLGADACQIITPFQH